MSIKMFRAFNFGPELGPVGVPTPEPIRGKIIRMWHPNHVNNPLDFVMGEWEYYEIPGDPHGGSIDPSWPVDPGGGGGGGGGESDPFVSPPSFDKLNADCDGEMELLQEIFNDIFIGGKLFTRIRWFPTALYNCLVEAWKAIKRIICIQGDPNIYQTRASGPTLLLNGGDMSPQAILNVLLGLASNLPCGSPVGNPDVQMHPITMAAIGGSGLEEGWIGLLCEKRHATGKFTSTKDNRIIIDRLGRMFTNSNWPNLPDPDWNFSNTHLLGTDARLKDCFK